MSGSSFLNLLVRLSCDEVLTGFFFIFLLASVSPLPLSLLSVRAKNDVYYLDVISSFPIENRDYDDCLL